MAEGSSNKGNPLSISCSNAYIHSIKGSNLVIGDRSCNRIKSISQKGDVKFPSGDIVGTKGEKRGSSGGQDGPRSKRTGLHQQGKAEGRKFKCADILRVWQSIKMKLPEEICGKCLLPFLADKGLLSQEKCITMSSMPRRKMACKLLNIVRKNLPDAFDDLQNALEETEHDYALCMLQDIINGKHVSEYGIAETLRKVRLKDLEAKWLDIVETLSEELYAQNLLSFLKEEKVLSNKEYKSLRKIVVRRDLVQKLLAIMKKNLPGAFYVLVNALEKYQQDSVLSRLNETIFRHV